MSIITRMRKQTAVWWEHTGSDTYGQPIYAEPIEIKCRWEDGETEVIMQNGDKLVAKGTVYVDRVMAVKDKLLLGELDTDMTSVPPDAAWEIKRFEQLSNLRNTRTLYTALL